jgi:hypothetical protein
LLQDKSELYNLNNANTTTKPEYETLLKAVIAAVVAHNATLEGAQRAEPTQPVCRHYLERQEMHWNHPTSS